MKIETIKIGILTVNTDEITLEDMPTQTMRDIYEICGKETAVNLLVNMQGNILQIPTRPWLKLQTRYIFDNYAYTAQSIKQIARTLSVTEKFVRDVLKTKTKNLPVSGQISIFEDAPAPAGAGQIAKSAVKSKE